MPGEHPSSEILQRLTDVIADRRQRQPENSYTARLLAAGLSTIAAKITEEAAEVVAAGALPGEAGRQQVVCESADLVFHLLVLLNWSGAKFSDVEAELERRFGISGLEEKATRESQHEQ